MRQVNVRRILEFFLVGLVMGIAEDLIAVKLATGANLDLRVIGIIALVALPFAIFSELVVDRKEW